MQRVGVCVFVCVLARHSREETRTERKGVKQQEEQVVVSYCLCVCVCLGWEQRRHTVRSLGELVGPLCLKEPQNNTRRPFQFICPSSMEAAGRRKTGKKKELRRVCVCVSCQTRAPAASIAAPPPSPPPHPAPI